MGVLAISSANSGDAIAPESDVMYLQLDALASAPCVRFVTDRFCHEREVVQFLKRNVNCHTTRSSSEGLSTGVCTTPVKQKTTGVKPSIPTHETFTVLNDSPHPTNRQRGSLLVIEDDPDVGEIVTLFLRQAGYDVTACTSSAEGVETATHLRPAGILCDMLMPQLDGGQVIRRLRADERTSGIPVILMSGDPIRCGNVASQAAAFLQKPFTVSELTGTVAAVLSRASQKAH